MDNCPIDLDQEFKEFLRKERIELRKVDSKDIVAYFTNKKEYLSICSRYRFTTYGGLRLATRYTTEAAVTYALKEYFLMKRTPKETILHKFY